MVTDFFGCGRGIAYLMVHIHTHKTWFKIDFKCMQYDNFNVLHFFLFVLCVLLEKKDCVLEEHSKNENHHITAFIIENK